MVDRRVNRTKRMIKIAFIDLLAEQSLPTIMVSEITERADVGRSTFYKYFDNVDDLFNQLSEGLIDDLATIITDDLQGEPTFDPARLMHKIMGYVVDHQQILTLFVHEGKNFTRDMKRTLRNDIIDTERIAKEDYRRKIRIAFAVDAVVDMLARWQLAEGQTDAYIMEQGIVSVLEKMFVK